MTREPAKNSTVSIRARLLALAQDRGQDYQRVLGRYAIERFLYRLGRSPTATDLRSKALGSLRSGPAILTGPRRIWTCLDGDRQPSMMSRKQFAPSARLKKTTAFSSTANRSRAPESR